MVFFLIHAGLVLAVYGLAMLPRTEATSTSWWVLASGIASLYGALVLAAFFVIWPLFTLARKVRQVLRWKEWLLKELPALLALVPTVVLAFKQAIAALRPTEQSFSVGQAPSASAEKTASASPVGTGPEQASSETQKSSPPQAA